MLHPISVSAPSSAGTVTAPATLPQNGGRPPWRFVPVLAVADRFRASMRLSVLVGLLLVPALLATVSFVLSANAQITFATRERAGVAVLRPVLSTTAGVLAGRSVDLRAIEDAVAANPGLNLGESLDAFRAAATDTGTPAGRVRFAQASQALITAIGNDSNLILDPDLDSFYVMDSLVVQMPKLLTAVAGAAHPVAAGGDDLVAEQAVRAGELASSGGALRSDVTTAVDTTAATGLGEQLAAVAPVADAAEAVAGTLTGKLGRTGLVRPGPLAEAVAAAVDPTSDALDRLLGTRITEDRSARDLPLTISVVGLVLAVWFALGVRWRTRTDVALAQAAVAAIASGDLSEHAVPHGRDEFGDIGRAIDVARRRLAQQEEEIRTAQANRMRDLVQGFAHQKRAQQQVRARAQTMIDDSAEAVLHELNEVMGQVDTVREAASTIDRQVTSADEVTRAVMAQADQANRVVSALMGSLRNVAGMAHLISGVADQTKLLALNATIEAARAGEAGRGFSVVANEVKELAMATARSTEQITTTIAELERDATAMTDAMGGVADGVTRMNGTTATLSEVATEQHELVARLDRAVGDALQRISSMQSLTERLDRRETERMPVQGVAQVHFGGRAFTAELRDLSTAGAKLILLESLPVQPGGTVDVELALTSEPVRVTATVVRGPGATSDEIGVRFERVPVSVEAAIAAHLESLASVDGHVDLDDVDALGSLPA